VQASAGEAESSEAQRKRRFRRTLVLLLLALVLLLLALVIYAFGQPGWQPDGSREAYDEAVRLLIAACLISGTLLGPLGLRELILAIAPSKALGLILAIVIGMGGLIAVPVELWLLSIVTDGLEPGSRERYESGDDDFDWDD
jgi:hypothetical protein